MRAIVCTALGDASNLALEEVPEPTLPPAGVRIRVRAAGVNFADNLLIAGKYQLKLPPPFIPGFEVAGEVVEVAERVTLCKAGDHVMAAVDAGGYAEEVTTRLDDVVVIPPGLDWGEAAALPVVWGTAHHSLAVKAALAAGEVLLVHGAASGVGLAAVAVGHALGATVIATAGGPDRLKVATEHGADFAIDYREENVAERVKALTGGRGADAVFDPVGGPMFEASLHCIAPGGRILAIGFASGTIPQIPANILLVKNASVIGYSFGGWRRNDAWGVRKSYQTLLGWLAEGRIRGFVSRRLPLAEAAQAILLLKDRSITGKVVLEV